MTISAIGLTCLEIIGMQMGGTGNVTRVQEIDREYRVTMAVATEMQFNMNSCRYDDDDNVSSLSTAIHIHECEHNGEPAWECIDSAKAPIDMLWV